MFKRLGKRDTFFWFKQLTENKGLEIQLTLKWKFAQWFKIAFESHRECDHERDEFSIELFRFFYFHVMVYDFRHWDYDKKTYCDYADRSFS